MIDLNAPIAQVLQQVTLMDIIQAYLIYVGVVLGLAAVFIVVGGWFFFWRKINQINKKFDRKREMFKRHINR